MFSTENIFSIACCVNGVTREPNRETEPRDDLAAVLVVDAHAHDVVRPHFDLGVLHRPAPDCRHDAMQLFEDRPHDQLHQFAERRRRLPHLVGHQLAEHRMRGAFQQHKAQAEGDPHPQCLARITPILQCHRPLLLQHLLVRSHQDLAIKLLLAPEIVIDRSDVDPRLVADLPHTPRDKPALRKHRRRRRQNALLAGLRVALSG